MINSQRYRADLDGLRAIAILCVVLFHAYPTLFPAGLIGVDIFFVLSGYLITRMLMRIGMSSIVDVFGFYQRRLQRLYPPLLLFLCAMLLLAWSRFSSIEYSALWQQSLAALLFSSNWYLACDEGVLSDANGANPLLHLWSLGIEGQFYLLWPWLFLRRWAAIRWWLVGVVAVLSIGSLLWLTHLQLAKWLFYAPSSRLFEMAAGAAVVYWHDRKGAISTDKSVLSGLVVLVCFFAVFYLVKPVELYPNGYTFLVVGAVAIIIASAPTAMINRGLSHYALVYIGRISYSWYLWHWGLLALYQQEVAPLALIGLSFLIAMCSYHAVELPLMRRRRSAYLFKVS